MPPPAIIDHLLQTLRIYLQSLQYGENFCFLKSKRQRTTAFPQQDRFRFAAVMAKKRMGCDPIRYGSRLIFGAADVCRPVRRTRAGHALASSRSEASVWVIARSPASGSST